jgi:hypothetical protein
VILAAALLVLVGLGLFVAGLLTGVTVLYWACVAACVVAAVLLFAVRRQVHQVATTTPAAVPSGTALPAGPAEPAEPVEGAGPPAAPAIAASAPAGPAATEPTATEEAAPPEPAPGTSGVTAESPPPPPAAPEDEGDPPVEEVEVTDLLLVVDLTDEVLVVDEHPRYHLAGCGYLTGRTEIPLPLDEARTDGFTPCGVCRPDATLADRVRARRRSADS